MKAEFVAPLAKEIVEVFHSVIGIAPTLGALSTRPDNATRHQINVTILISGDLEGVIVYGMSIRTADKIASKMTGIAIVTFDQTAATAIAELGLHVSSATDAALAKHGRSVYIAPPTIVRGANVSVSAVDHPSLVIPMTLAEYGEVEVSLSVKERDLVPRAA